LCPSSDIISDQLKKTGWLWNGHAEGEMRNTYQILDKKKKTEGKRSLKKT
jgi:hypothetical protein